MEYFYQGKYLDEEGAKAKVFCQATSRLIKEVFESASKATRRVEFFTSLLMDQFSECKQHDCQEFINFYLARLQAELNPSRSPPAPRTTEEQAFEQYSKSNCSIVDKMLTVFTINRIVCQACGKMRERYEPHLHLALSLGRDSTLEEIVTQLMSEEELEDALECDHCKASSKGSLIRLLISRLPRYLLLYVKRYKVSGLKSNYVLRFGQTLELGRILETKGRFLYRLQGIIVHKGMATAGHYLAFVRRGERWFSCSDEAIAEVRLEQVLYEEPYMLLYKHQE